MFVVVMIKGSESTTSAGGQSCAIALQSHAGLHQYPHDEGHDPTASSASHTIHGEYCIALSLRPLQSTEVVCIGLESLIIMWLNMLNPDVICILTRSRIYF